ncbi:unnamed protein product [Gadus morhua 'NCC']
MRSVGPVVVLCLALLLLSPAPPTEGSLPELTSPAADQLGPVSPPPGRAVSPHSDNRLPGVCRRLRRRRITVLCNSDKFCSSPGGSASLRRRSGGSSPGQTCRCPRASRCSHVFIRSSL